MNAVIEDYRRDFINCQKGSLQLTHNARRRIALGLVATRKFRRTSDSSDPGRPPASGLSHNVMSRLQDQRLPSQPGQHHARPDYGPSHANDQINYTRMSDVVRHGPEYQSDGLKNSQFSSSSSSSTSGGHRSTSRLKTPVIQIRRNGTVDMSGFNSRFEGVKTKHRTRVYISNSEDNNQNDADASDSTPAVVMISKATQVTSEADDNDEKSSRICDKPTAEPPHYVNLPLPNLFQSHFHNTAPRPLLRYSSDSSSSQDMSTTSSSRDKIKLVGILKSPGKRRHFRKHVEFLDRQEKSVRYF